MHTKSDDHGMDEVEPGDGHDAARADLRKPRGLRYRRTGIATTRPAMPRTSNASTRGSPAAAAARTGDLLIVTADHGNDPTTPSTDHSREHVPLFVGRHVGQGRRRPRHAADVRRPRADARGALRRRPARPRHELPAGYAGVDDGGRRAGRAAGRQSIREQLEAREREILAPQAAKSGDTRGRLRPRPRIRSARRFSAIAIASSTARRSAG